MNRKQRVFTWIILPLTVLTIVALIVVNIFLAVAHNGAVQKIASLKATATVLTYQNLADRDVYNGIIGKVDLGSYNLSDQHDVTRALTALSKPILIPPSNDTVVVWFYAKFDLCWNVAPCDSLFGNPQNLVLGNCTSDYVGCVDIDSTYKGDFSISPNDAGYASFKIVPHAQPLTILASVPIICSAKNACWAGYPDIQP